MATPNPADVASLDGWIQSLMQCKQLGENDIKKLCEKVGGLTRAVTSRVDSHPESFHNMN
jgi:hypothetical protein